MSSLRAAIASTCLWLFPAALGAQPSAPDAAGTTNAIWVEEEISFAYMGMTTYYSCDGLRDKLRWVLKEIGARPGYTVTVSGCMDTGPDLMPYARIKAAMLRQATPELLAELEKDAPRRELIARATGKGEELNEATAQLPARPRRIEFRDSPRGRIEAGDCELVEQLRDRVFIPLGAKVIEDEMHCTPKHLALGGVRLTIEVLEPVPSQ